MKSASGAPVPAIGQGTWDLPESGSRRTEAIAALRRGIELGMTHLDMAEMYGNGRVEEIVAEAIEGFDRAGLFLTSKVLPSNASFEGAIAACERTLRRLRTDYVDLYLLHWRGSAPLEETMRALEQLVTQGKARYIGVSNFDVDELQEAQSHMRAVSIACDQVLYHLNERTAEARLIPYCERQGIAFAGYTPFGRRRFPHREAQSDGVLGRIAERRGTTARCVILKFLTRLPGTLAIPKASTVAHVEANASACDVQLDTQDVAAIDVAFPVRDGPISSL